MFSQEYLSAWDARKQESLRKNFQPWKTLCTSVFKAFILSIYVFFPETSSVADWITKCEQGGIHPLLIVNVRF
jgi:hypothetical protein